jgi:outer membrane protein assembly factor BamA
MLAQTSWKSEHCQLLATATDPRGPQVVVDNVVLDGTTDVAESIWNGIVSETKAEMFLGDAWLDQLREVNLRGGLENHGYLKVEVSTEAKVISSSPALEHVVVHARLRVGPQYTLSGVQSRNVDSEGHLAFSAEELRTLVPLHEGDLFSAEKVREAITALTKYYGAHGYIDFVAEPKTEIDDVHQQVAWVVSLQEGLQFRLGDIEIIGLDSTLEKELRSKIRTGDILNFQLIVDFYREHKSELPEEVLPEDTVLRRNIKERTADALFDFRSCSQLQNLGTSILPIPNHSARSG